MALQRAVIEVHPSDRGGNLPDRIEVQFNPTEYTLSKGAQIAEIALPGIDSPILQFIRGQTEKLALDLFFDTTDAGMGETGVVDVRTRTRPVYQLVKIQPNTHAPPRVTFMWGTGLSFRANVLGYVILEAYLAHPFQRPGRNWVWGFQLAPGW